MTEMLLPRTLIVIQVVFGAPLRGMREFRSGDIAKLTDRNLGKGNYAKTLSKLVKMGWVKRTERRQLGSRMGRPSNYVYTRTQLGRDEYNFLRSDLAKYGIHLT